MPATNIRTASYASATAASVNLDIVSGVGNNRNVIAFFKQERTPLNLTGGSIASQVNPGTAIDGGPIDTADIQRIRALRWTDADLPAAAGTYAVSASGASTSANMIGAIYWEGGSQGALDDSDQIIHTGAGGALTFTLAGATSGAMLIAGYVENGSSTQAKNGSQIDIFAPAAVGSAANFGMSYIEGGTSIGYATSNNFTAAFAVAIGLAAAGPTGDLDATESGDDVFEAEGGLATNGIRLTLRDTDTGALAASLTDLIVSIRANSDDEATLAKSAAETTDGSGVIEFASTAIGDPGDWVYVTVEKSDNSTVAAYRVQVVDLTA